MKRFSFAFLFVGLALWLTLITPAFADSLEQHMKAAAHPLPPELAFKPDVQIKDDQLIIDFTIAPGTYLYQKDFQVSSTDAHLGDPILPKGESTHDAFFGNTIIYRDHMSFQAPILSMQQRNIEVILAYQGCNDIGFCYPPQTQRFTLQAPIKAPGQIEKPHSEQDKAFSLLRDQHMLIALLSFFGFGLLLAFTPCVLPMVPILSALIIDEQQHRHERHAFFMACTYVLAMACTYAGMGALVASLGSLVQTRLQSPWVLGFTAFILVFLAFWLAFDHRFTLFMKGNSPLHKISQSLPRGDFFGVALMGVIASLVVSPCVTAPLVGALSYIALSGNIWLGSAALFCLALGMGIPLIAFAWGGTALLPKRGPWMHAIKLVFAAVLVIMAFNLVARFLPNPFNTHEKSEELPFVYIHNVEELKSALAEHKDESAVTMVDFYADWCKNCVVMEQTVFKDAQVRSLFMQVKLLKVDVTEYNASIGGLQREWGVYGPPALLFFDAQGKEIPELRLVGDVSTPCMIAHLEAVIHHKTVANCSK